MRYEIPYIQTSSKYAKNKFMIPERITLDTNDVKWFVCDASSDQDAYHLISKIIYPKDERPVSGKSYLRNFRCNENNRGTLAPQHKLPKYKVEDEVVLHQPYHNCSKGFINENLTDFIYCITLDVYHNQYVDFSSREFCLKCHKK